MSWGSEHWLWALGLPLLLLMWDAFHRSRPSVRAQLPQAKIATTWLGGIDESRAKQKRPIRSLLYLALACLIVAMAQPRWGTEKRVTFQRSREVILAIDLSRSMLAEDLRPNRLERAKLVVESMLDSLQGESVGLIVFAGTAFLQSPMSPDYQILRGFLKNLNPSFIPQGGTNYASMLEVALDSFAQSDGLADRFLIVISDGEAHDASWRPLAEELKQQNVRAISIGIGTRDGGLIPDGSGSYHKNRDGAVVLSKLEPSTLSELARITGGVYREVGSWIDLGQLVEETVKQGRATLSESEREESEIERYHYFLAPGLILLLLSIYREYPNRPRPRTIQRRANA